MIKKDYKISKWIRKTKKYQTDYKRLLKTSPGLDHLDRIDWRDGIDRESFSNIYNWEKNKKYGQDLSQKSLDWDSIFWLGRNPRWSSLSHFRQSDPIWLKVKWPFLSSCWMWKFFMSTFFNWGEFQFDQVWSILDSSDPIWSKI